MKKIRCFLILILFLTGCSNYDMNMKINKNKSMEYTVIILSDDQSDIVNNISVYKGKLEQYGYVINDYNIDNKYGMIISKRFDNIDDISYGKVNDEFNLLYLYTDGYDKNIENKMFSVDKSIFKNKYFANFYVDLSNLGIDLNNTTVTYKVELPNGSVSNNSNFVSSDGNMLTWNITSLEKSDIDFVFELKSYDYIYYGCAILIVIILIVSIISNLFGKKNDDDDFKVNEDKKSNYNNKMEENTLKQIPDTNVIKEINREDDIGAVNNNINNVEDSNNSEILPVEIQSSIINDDSVNANREPKIVNNANESSEEFEANKSIPDLVSLLGLPPVKNNINDEFNMVVNSINKGNIVNDSSVSLDNDNTFKKEENINNNFVKDNDLNNDESDLGEFINVKPITNNNINELSNSEIVNDSDVNSDIIDNINNVDNLVINVNSRSIVIDDSKKEQ